MRIIKRILVFVVVLIALLLILAAFVDGHLKIDRTADVRAPRDTVWQHVNSIAALNTWNPFLKKDPNVKISYEGTQGAPGSKMCFASEMKGLGSGCETLLAVNAPVSVDGIVEFEKPNKRVVHFSVTLDSIASGTRVSWRSSAELPYPFRLIKLFANFDKTIGTDLEHGLQTLKSESEAR